MRTLTFIACSVLLLSLLRICIVSSAPMYEHAALQGADECDWIGSGGGDRGVRPVYLRCSRGTISWRYPRGALRIVLSPPILTGSVSKLHFEMIEKGGNNGNTSIGDIVRLSGFRTCTKVSGPVRVYLETRGKLRSMYSPRDGKHEASHRCFRAKKQPAALYIEAEEPLMSGERHDAKLQYDLELRYADNGRELRTRRFNEEEEEDCRPCSMDELAKAYCQSDFVARGTVSAVQRQPNLEAAELVLGIIKILRLIEENEGNNDVDVADSYDRRNIRVRVPTACDARHGQGEFVVMAKRRLGDLVLVCAPRLETWVKTVRELESAPCVLRS
ncbi:meteorin [Ptiloglossa arizonensis]|uniref:meteorin n=1 Tax=Ptiloglossa arizonensis TaxID=3350558 RepID=UPI003FA0ED37